jgi:phosphatidylserine/phosphatidylglycerophosphate/cardiolipin synthase-like enzyme
MVKIARGFLLLLLLIPLIGHAERFEKSASYSVCFTPGEDCTRQIVAAIDGAVNSIAVQAYAFTSRPIGKALVTAKERGVNVEIIFDKSILERGRGTTGFFQRHGVPLWIDNQLAIAHNKVMIIDQTRVITGSFNFTRAAQQNNAENLLIIDDAALAKKYLQNWQRRQMASKALVLAPLAQNPENFIARFWHWLLQWLGRYL